MSREGRRRVGERIRKKTINVSKVGELARKKNNNIYVIIIITM
jgi:hypothetical protein